MNTLFVDSHEDLAYNAQVFGRNYLKSAAEIRHEEKHSKTPQRNGDALLGLADWKKANTAIIFCTVFVSPWHRRSGEWELPAYRDKNEAFQLMQQQIDYYQALVDYNPEDFQLLSDRKHLNLHWEARLNNPEKQNPIGLIPLIEGAEGIKEPESIEYWYERGVRMVGPIWAGNRFFDSQRPGSGFDGEGKLLLDVMADLGMGLDLSHMTETLTLEAIDRYEGSIFATHANARALVGDAHGERHFTDRSIRGLAERDGVIGVMPFNRFLKADWTKSQPRDKVTLYHLVDHIDHICQLTGSALHVGIGTDFDGGFGYPEVPLELDSIADIQKLTDLLSERGYMKSDIQKIMGENWKRILERILP